MTTAEATVAALVAHGIDTIYALPGLHNDPLFDALFGAADRIRTIHTRHEQGAAYMALGAALATAKPQAYAVVPGPGLLNSAAALLTAYGMNAPVLALIGQISQSAIGRGLGHLHEIHDQRGIIERLVDFCARIRQPGDATGLVAQAVLAMRTGRPAPRCWNARWTFGVAALQSPWRHPCRYRNRRWTRRPSAMPPGALPPPSAQ